MVRAYASDPAILLGDCRDLDVLKYANPGAARALCHSLRHVSGVYLSVFRQEDGADQIVHIDQRVQCLRFGEADLFHL